VADVTGTYDEDIPLSREDAAARRAVEWVMTHDLSDQFPGDEVASAELAAQLPTAAQPVTAESVDAMLVTTSCGSRWARNAGSKRMPRRMA
jgi:hypothetical protein